MHRLSIHTNQQPTKYPWIPLDSYKVEDNHTNPSKNKTFCCLQTAVAQGCGEATEEGGRIFRLGFEKYFNTCQPYISICKSCTPFERKFKTKFIAPFGFLMCVFILKTSRPCALGLVFFFSISKDNRGMVLQVYHWTCNIDAWDPICFFPAESGHGQGYL